MVKEQKITDDYAIYHGDCMHVLPSMDDKSVDCSIYSPPFAGLYNYSSSINDFSNCESKKQFLEQYEFAVKEIARITKPGRISAVHCQDILTNTTSHTLWDFPHELIMLHEKYGMHFKNRITIWKEPLEVRMRTMVKSLMHKMIVEDATKCFTAIPDYVLIFVKAGENKVPVTHVKGLCKYAGETPMLPAIEKKYRRFNHLKIKYNNWEDPRTNKLSHVIWQRYASSVWDDIRGNNVLKFKESKDEDDEKHVHPLQIDIIDRLVTLYTNKGETVLTPFMGVGSEVYSPVRLGRKAIGIELKESYYKQAVQNLKSVKEESQEPQLQLLLAKFNVN